jgi:predicted nucleotidyltransferase
MLQSEGNRTMTREDILKEIKCRLSKAHGKRLRGAVLYGSEARGTAGPDSDIDVLVLLEGPVDYGRDLQTNIKTLYQLSLQIERPISAKPIEASEYESVECPLYQRAHKEGILI